MRPENDMYGKVWIDRICVKINKSNQMSCQRKITSLDETYAEIW